MVTGFTVYMEQGRGAARRVIYWNRAARAWQAMPSIECRYPTARGAARRMQAAFNAHCHEMVPGESAIGFKPY